jgi:hypothetical protein
MQYAMRRTRSISLIACFSMLAGATTSCVAPVTDSSSHDEAAVLTTDDGLKLDAIWTLPANTPRAVVVILPGSGNVKTDGDVSSPILGSGYQGEPAKLSDQLAATLASSGIASFRYTKRGYAPDPARAINAPVGLLIQDAGSALSVAERRFPQLKTGLVGFSEGALIATIVASEQNVDTLFLLGLPTRSIDEMFSYQFTQWPVDLVKSRLDLNHDGILSESELSQLGPDGIFPLLGPAFSGESWKDLDTNGNNSISISDELIPAYQKTFSAVQSVMQTPGYVQWYSSFQQLAPFEDFAEKVTANVYLYQAIDDAQVNWSWVVSDQHYFAHVSKLRLFSNLGHCFAPMEGTIGDIKTSGPFDYTLLDALDVDLGEGL